jgi:pre-60S factor REI1
MEQHNEEEGFYSSTSGTYFPDKQSLAEHYASDLHRYNLKRKVAGLPPVTKDWFDARKEQLTLSRGGSEVQKVNPDVYALLRRINSRACMLR